VPEGFEAPVTYLPWASKEEVSRLRNDILSALEELKRIKDGLRSVEEKVIKAEGAARDASAVKEEVKAIASTLSNLRGRVGAVEGRVGEIQGRVARLEALAELTLMVGKWKASTCGRCKGELCTAWRLGREAANVLAKRFGQDAVVGGDNDVWRVRVSKVPYLCALCPLYEPRAVKAEK
jgi:hypothetical protein